LSPIVILTAHTLLIWRQASLAGTPLLRFLATYAPAVVLLLLAWKFSPYIAARPLHEKDTSLGLYVVYLHAAVIALDSILIAFGMLLAHVDLTDHTGRPWRVAVRPALIALKLVALAAIPVFIAISVAAWLPTGALWWDAVPITSLITTVLCVLVATLGIALASSPSAISRLTEKLVPAEPTALGRFVPMKIALTAVLLLVPALSLSAHPRPLDLAGARLIAREPTEALLAALLSGVQDAEHLKRQNQMAWDAFGRGITLDDWQFPGVSFQSASMQKISLERANLRAANLIGANLTGARLAHADLSGASLTGADLTGASAKPTLFAQETPPAVTANASNPVSIDLSNAILKNAVLTDAKLAGAILTGADLTGATLQCTDLTDANLTNATIIGTDLTTATLDGAKIAGATFCGSNLSKVDLSRAIWTRDVSSGNAQAANQDPISFFKANLQGATLPYGLAGTDFRKAKLYHTEFARGTEETLTKIDLTNAKMEGAEATEAYDPRTDYKEEDCR
jgi:uncharacterized protein YjbI with pentapeptide repeats